MALQHVAQKQEQEKSTMPPLSPPKVELSSLSLRAHPDKLKVNNFLTCIAFVCESNHAVDT